MTPAAIRLGLPPLVPWLCLVGGPVLGGALGWGVARLARAAEAWPWVPVDGPLALAAAVPAPWVVAILALAGVDAWLAREARRGDLVPLVGPESIAARQGGWCEAFPRDAVAGVRRDGGEVVLLAPSGGELLRGSSEASPAATGRACEAMGYPRLGDGDPFASSRRAWIDGHPDLEARGHALLRLRREAVARDDDAQARRLARDLAGGGVEALSRGLGALDPVGADVAVAGAPLAPSA